MRPTALPTQRRRAWWQRPALACVTALCPTATALAQPAPDDFARQVLAEVNLYRESRQLQPLQPAPWLATLAAEHSAHMAQLGGLSHAGFQTRFLRSRRQTCVENLAAGFRQADLLVQGWRASASHHQNLLDARVQDVGVASVNGHVTWLACAAEDPAPR